MKAIQVTFDEDLLRRVDSTEEAKARGRSAVFRQAVAEWLERRRAQVIAEGYENAYGSERGLGREFTGWEEQGRWPKS